MDVSTESPAQATREADKPSSKPELGDEGLGAQEPAKASSKEASKPSGEAEAEPPLKDAAEDKSGDDVAAVAKAVADLRTADLNDPAGQRADAEEMASQTEDGSKPEEARAEDEPPVKLQAGGAQTVTFAWKIGSLTD